MYDQVSLALLVGGKSTRMGEDKAFAPFHDGTLLQWMWNRYSLLFAHAFVVARESARFHTLGLPVVVDALAEHGSAVGVYTATLASPTERVICLACDMPFVTPRFLQTLAERSPGFDVFVPKANGALYKVLTLLPRGWREAIGRAMKVDRLMLEVDHGARRAYEERAAASEPSADDPADAAEPAQRDALDAFAGEAAAADPRWSADGFCNGFWHGRAGIEFIGARP